MARYLPSGEKEANCCHSATSGWRISCAGGQVRHAEHGVIPASPSDERAAPGAKRLDIAQENLDLPSDERGDEAVVDVFDREAVGRLSPPRAPAWPTARNGRESGHAETRFR